MKQTLRDRARKILDAGKSSGWTLAMLKALKPKTSEEWAFWESLPFESLAISAAIERWQKSKGKKRA